MGIEDGRIQDAHIHASSSLDDHHPTQARLKVQPQCGPYRPTNGWSPSVDDGCQFITVYFPNPRIVTGIITQGHGFEEKWVEEYLVFYQSHHGGSCYPVKTYDGERMVS